MPIEKTSQDLSLPIDRDGIKQELQFMRELLVDALSEVQTTVNIFNQNIETVTQAIREGRVSPELLQALSEIEGLGEVVEKVIRGDKISKEQAKALVDALERFGRSVEQFQEVIVVDLGSVVRDLSTGLLREDLPETVRRGFLESIQGIFKVYSEKLMAIMKSADEEFIVALETNRKFFDSLVNKLDKDTQAKVKQLEQELRTTVDEQRRAEIVSEIRKQLEPVAVIPQSLKELQLIQAEQIKFDKDTTEYLRSLISRIESDVTDIKIYSTLKDLNRNMDKLVLTNQEIEDTLETQTSFGKSLRELFLENPQFGVRELSKGVIQTVLSAFGLGFLSPLVEGIDPFELATRGFGKLRGVGWRINRASRIGGILGRTAGTFAPEIGRSITGTTRTAGRLGGLLGQIGRVGGAISAGMGGLGGGLLSGLKAGARFLGPVGLLLTAGTALGGGLSGWREAENIFGVKEATLGQKLSAGAGGLLSSLTLGLIDRESLARGIYNIGGRVGNFVKSVVNPENLAKINPIGFVSGLFDKSKDEIRGVAPVKTPSEKVVATEITRRVEGAKPQQPSQVVMPPSTKPQPQPVGQAKVIDDKDLLLVNSLLFA